jgi:hypothetical protein
MGVGAGREHAVASAKAASLIIFFSSEPNIAALPLWWETRMNISLTIGWTALVLLLALLWNHQLRLRREAYIRTCALPHGLFDKLRKRHPDLALKDCQLVAHGLRQFFLAHLKSGCKFVSMPTQVTDDLWHEFILYTKSYKTFCQRAFGRFLHHTPAIALGGGRRSNAGLRRCWWFACLEENINPRAAMRLPLLFALDAKLKIPNGFHYAADCQSLRKTPAGSSQGPVVHCSGDFSTTSFDGSDEGFGDSGNDAGGAGGDSGGADSGGCGGGGCGGGGD